MEFQRRCWADLRALAKSHVIWEAGRTGGERRDFNRTQAVYSASIVYVTSDDDPRRMAYSTKRVYRGVRTTPPGKRDTGRKRGYANDRGGDVPHETTETRSPKSP